MRRLFTFVIMIMLVCYLGLSASAENSLNWSAVETTVKESEIDADFVQIGNLNLKMWLPSIFVGQELTDEDIRNGYIAYITTADESAAISVVTADIGESLVDWQAGLQKFWIKGAEIGTVNGLQAVFYSSGADDSMCLDFEVESGELLEFTFYPMSDKEFQSLAAIIMASVQPIE